MWKTCCAELERYRSSHSGRTGENVLEIAGPQTNVYQTLWLTLVANFVQPVVSSAAAPVSGSHRPEG